MFPLFSLPELVGRLKVKETEFNANKKKMESLDETNGALSKIISAIKFMSTVTGAL